MQLDPASLPVDVPAFIRAGLHAAIAAGEAAWGTTSPNPPVGAAIITATGEVIATGHTQAVGGDHAEIQALKAAGAAARGQYMVVTLEPCNHTGRTGPCSHAIAAAGIQGVFYCQRDPGKAEGGGAVWLAQRGIQATCINLPVAALEPWLFAFDHQRPFVIAKTAHTLDGRIAAADGSSQWITGPQARQHAHTVRAHADAILVGTGTVFADNPRLTARTPAGREYEHQPQPVVIGSSVIPAGYHLFGAPQYGSLAAAMDALFDQGARTVLLEGGAGLLSSALQASVVQQLHAYIAPAILGSGLGAYRGFEAPTMAAIRRLIPQATIDLPPDICRILALPLSRASSRASSSAAQR
ncbi:MAG: bifunctional diaminohydroxyphosphoribosylaminopyrimidine deaminase/5-amino-6-(5-phosphoribosylamino)uracil reductase RibD [Corynebacterium sp.]|nr:bifunctional diaminohydroxyphosphoribosylaminopyrimidine deaminase/5-amino-6-(5-phosphoribosylamino)uracil reductase RibD [Corynebacterium sp.]